MVILLLTVAPVRLCLIYRPLQIAHSFNQPSFTPWSDSLSSPSFEPRCSSCLSGPGGPVSAHASQIAQPALSSSTRTSQVGDEAASPRWTSWTTSDDLTVSRHNDKPTLDLSLARTPEEGLSFSLAPTLSCTSSAPSPCSSWPSSATSLSPQQPPPTRSLPPHSPTCVSSPHHPRPAPKSRSLHAPPHLSCSTSPARLYATPTLTSASTYQMGSTHPARCSSFGHATATPTSSGRLRKEATELYSGLGGMSAWI